MGVGRKTLALAAAAILAAVSVHATSIVPPENLGELARSSEAVVLAVAGASHASYRGPLIFTQTSFRVVQVVAGPVEARERITVEAPGGDLDGNIWVVPGSPRFEPGQVYLLFLDQKPTGEWLPKVMAYGILRRVTGRDGSALLAPLPEEVDIQPFLRDDGILPEPVETYVETTLLSHLREVTAGRQRWNARAVTARSEQVPMEVYAQWPPDADCTYITGGTPYARWPYNVSPALGQVKMYAQASGDPSIAGGGFAEVQGAIGMWMDISNTSLNLAYGGAQPYTLPCSGGCTSGSNHVPCANPFGSNTGVVVFNDPCGEIADPACPGVLGFGGPYIGGSHIFDGNTWYSIGSWFVVINNGAGCVGSQGYTRMMAHEMGHGLGFGHFPDPNALMFGVCCSNTINATDTGCTRYTYPGSTPPGPTATPTATRTPTPTPTPPTSPPPAPTGVTASDGTWSDRVRILWNASATATSYHVYRNTTNNSGSATDLGSVPGTGADDLSAVAGTTYYYWVKAFNALGGSPFSSPDTGYRATGVVPTPTPTLIPTVTPTPPPAPPPAPTGVSASDGTFSDRIRITWNAAAGATSYHVFRNTTNDSGSASSLASVASTSYDDSSASGSQVYWYWVRAFNAAGGSPYSTSDSGYRAGAGPTPTPTPFAGLTAAFTFLPTAPLAGQQVQFTDTSAGATSWLWTFGDGRTSTARNPVYTYATRGSYGVMLRIGNGSGSAQTSKAIIVGARARRHLSKR